MGNPLALKVVSNFLTILIKFDSSGEHIVVSTYTVNKLQ